MDLKVEFINLGSGSRGNCTWLQYGETALLIDAGFSCKQLKERMRAIGKDPARLSGILVTHGHKDHLDGIGLFCKEFQTPVYCNALTQREICCELNKKNRVSPQFNLFRTGDSFELGGIGVTTFEISHDAADPVGYLFKVGSIQLGIATDLGRVTPLVAQRLKGAYGLLFESNHDQNLLLHSSRAWRLKQRIMGPSGHLSNEQSAQAVSSIAEFGLKELVLGHLSEECNRPEIALHVMKEALNGAAINVRVSSQTHCTNILPEGFTI